MTDQELYEEGWERFPWVCSLQTPLHLPGQGRQADVKVRGRCTVSRSFHRLGAKT
jgi:hypothetical protein